MLEFFRLEGIAYNMATLAESAAALRKAGFESVEIRDRHDWYLDLAQRELHAMEGRLNPVIVQRIGAERARHFIDNWRQLVVVLEARRASPWALESGQTWRFETGNRLHLARKSVMSLMVACGVFFHDPMTGVGNDAAGDVAGHKA